MKASKAARAAFYRDTIGEWIPDRVSSVLVVAGGGTDYQVLRGLGFSDVTNHYSGFPLVCEGLSSVQMAP